MSSNSYNISDDEKELLNEWIKQIEELKKELQMMKEEGQGAAIVSDIASKITRIHTGLHLWKFKNIERG